MQRSFNILFLLCALAVHAEAEPLSNYDIIARLTQAPGNVTVTGAGRIIMSQHQSTNHNIRWSSATTTIHSRHFPTKS